MKILLTILFIIVSCVILTYSSKVLGIYNILYHSKGSDIVFFIIGIILVLTSGYNLFFK